MRVKAVVFDLFDTLLLIRGGDAFYEPALKRLHSYLVNQGFNVSFEGFRRAYFLVRDEIYIETAKSLEEPHFDIRLSLTLRKLGYDFDASHPIVKGGTRTFAEEFMRHVDLDEKAVEVLRKLREKYKLGIVSNLSIPEAAWELLEKFDLKKYFGAIIISGEAKKRKPSPEIFEKALKILEVKGSEAIFIGDTLSTDIKGAKNMGMQTILIKRDSSKTLFWESEEKDQVKPDKIITSLKELPKILENFENKNIQT